MIRTLHRLFIAINLPERVKKELAMLGKKYPFLPAKWTRPENLHVTLLFIGNANDQETGEICNKVKDIAVRHRQFLLDIDKIAYGPLRKMPPRMIWALGKPSKELGELRADAERTLFDNGSQGQAGAGMFLPHITLARIIQHYLRQTEREDFPAVNEQIHLDFYVESIEVMESELKRNGPVYTVLESARLSE